MKNSVCIGIHAVFAEGAYKELIDSGLDVVTCNTIVHESNIIDISEMIIKELSK